MYHYTKLVENLIDEISKLPGIGPKTAERITFYLLKSSPEEGMRLAEAIKGVKERIKSCSLCNNFSENDLCPICQDGRRDRSLICVVEQPKDIVALERTNRYRGLYHVLMGAISPLDGIGPKELKIDGLMDRLKKEKVEEVILATNPNAEGEVTALYLHKLLKPQGIKVTHLARGIPVGGQLDYVDEVTLAKALEGRREL